MKNLFLFCFVNFFIISNGFSQSIEIEEGATYNTKNKTMYGNTIESLLGISKNTLVLSRRAYKGEIIEKYNLKSNELMYSTKIELDHKRLEHIYSEKTFLFNGIVYYYYHIHYLRTSEKVLFLKTINENGTVSEAKEISRGFLSNPGEKLINETYFHFSLSPDSTILAITKVQNSKEKLPTVEAKLYRTDNGTELKSISLPNQYGKSNAMSTEYNVDNDGNFVFSMYYLNSKQQIALALCLIPSHSTSVQTVELNLSQNKDILNTKLKFNQFDNSVNLMGNFKETKTEIVKKKEKEIYKGGLFSFKIDLKKWVLLNKSELNFSDYVEDKLTYQINMLKGKSAAEKPLYIKEIVEFNQENYIVLVNKYSYIGSGPSQTHENEIIVAKANNSGTLEWVKIIPKSTINDVKEFNIVIKNKLNFIFLEDPKTTEKITDIENYEKLPSFILAHKNKNVVCVSITSSGKLEKSVVKTNTDFSLIPTSTTIYLENRNKILIRSVRGGEEKFGYLKVN